MNVIFFKSHTFCAKEIENALKNRKNIKLIISAIPEKIPAEAAHQVFDQIKSYMPAIVISVNNAGYDYQGTLSDLIASSGSFQCNWFVDDPFYEDIFYNRRLPNLKNRLDFVTEETFVTPMRQKGYNAHFLPLAVDPDYFKADGAVGYARDCAFVGNSSIDFMDSIITVDAQQELQNHAELLNTLKKKYYNDPYSFDIKKYLLNNQSLWRKNSVTDAEKFIFRIEWLVGYFYRRDFIVELSEKLENRFTCFGDIYWSKLINKSLVSTDACYYTNLCSYNRSTRVNINMNRIQIKTSFTQRIFDCKACGAFILTEKRAQNDKFFITKGDKKELAEFSSWPECLKLIDYYCAHEEEREAIAKAGMERVLAEHTYNRRMERIFELCKKEWGL